MYPVLLEIGGVTLDTYSAVWLIALSSAILWSVRRFSLYDVDDDEARRIIGWAFLSMLLGARAIEYVWNFQAYLKDPALFLDLQRGGLSEVGAYCGAFLTAFLLCRREPKVSFQSLCGVVALPAFLTMAVGRWGCFLNGCCFGLVSRSPLAVHFPFDPGGVARHPTQLYYSASSVAILLLLWRVERLLLGRAAGGQERLAGGALTSLGLVFYTLMRLSVDVLRQDGLTKGISFSHWLLLAALPFECLWLLFSLRALRSPRSS